MNHSNTSSDACWWRASWTTHTRHTVCLWIEPLPSTHLLLRDIFVDRLVHSEMMIIIIMFITLLQLPPRTQHCLKVARDYWSRRDPDKTKRVPLAVLRDSLLYTSDCDALPNYLVTRLLQEADKNQDGYLNYDEYLIFVSTRESGFSRRSMQAGLQAK